MKVASFTVIIQAFLHTVVRLLPIGLYFFCYFSILLFQDMRGVLLLFGLLSNDVLGTIYKKLYKIPDKYSCSILGSPDGEGAPNLPNTNTNYISFILSFFVCNAIEKGEKNPTTVIFTSLLLAITIWSRTSTGCKTIRTALISCIVGFIYGAIYFYFISDYWKDAEKGYYERKVCDQGYKDYKCSTIKNGLIIEKEQEKDLQKLEEDEERKKRDEIYESYPEPN